MRRKKITELEHTKKKNKTRQEKNMQILEDIAKAVGIIICVLLLIIITSSIIITCSQAEPPTPPQEVINETCEKANLIPKGYVKNFKEHRTYILCGIPYFPEEAIRYTPQTKIKWTNKCCYPTECKSKNNPPDCTCIYPVYCYEE